MRLRRRPRPKRCDDCLRGYKVAGLSVWRCELAAGHAGPHERVTPPVTGIWTTELLDGGGWRQQSSIHAGGPK